MSGTPLSELNQTEHLDNVLDEIEEEYKNIPEDGDYDDMERERQERFRDYQHDDSQTHYYREADEARANERQLEEQKRRYEAFQQQQNGSWGRFILEQVKSPLVFILLFMLLNWQVVEHLLLKYLPPSVSAFSLVIRALLGALVFYLTNTFVLPMI